MFIYAITNDLNDKVYIGLHFGRDLRKRWGTHVAHSRGKSRSPISAAIRKHGESKFHITAIWSGHVAIEQLKNLEAYFIKSFHSRVPNGYNLTDGGDGTVGFRHSPQERIERSMRMRSQIASGNIPSTKGIPRNPQLISRISRSRIGTHYKKHSQEANAAKALLMKGNSFSRGYKQTAEHIKKKIETRRLRTSWNERNKIQRGELPATHEEGGN